MYGTAFVKLLLKRYKIIIVSYNKQYGNAILAFYCIITDNKMFERVK